MEESHGEVGGGWGGEHGRDRLILLHEIMKACIYFKLELLVS